MGLCRHVRLFDCSELDERAEEVGLIAGFCDLPVSKPIQADPADCYFLICRRNACKGPGMGRLQRPTNDNPIVSCDHFINTEAGIPKRFSNRPLITPGALDAKSGGLMTVIDIVIVNDFIEDLRVPIVIGVIKTLNHVEIRF